MKAVFLTESYKDIYFKSAEGLTLYARDYDNNTDKPALLCLHGLTRNSADFHDLALHLNERFRIITVDQRGRGKSENDPDPSKYRPDIYCSDVFALLENLKLQNVVVIGTSMGGIMIMMMAAEKPGLFRGAIINDIGPEIDPAGLIRIQGYVGATHEFASWEDAARSIKTQQGTDVFPLYSFDDWLAFAKRTCVEKADGKIQFAYDPALANPFKDDETVSSPVDMWPLFESLHSIPVMTIRGQRSDILSEQTLNAMERSHPDFKAVTIPDIGHAPILTEPQSLKAIDSFLETFK